MSQLGNIYTSYGSQFNISVANTYSNNVITATGLPQNNMIIAAMPDEDGNDMSYSIIMTDNEGNAARLTYTINEDNILYSYNDVISMHIDDDTIVENQNNALYINSNALFDNTTVSYGTVQTSQLSIASSNKYGVAAIDGYTVKKDSSNNYYVDTDNLNIASVSEHGIAMPDNDTTSIEDGKLYVVTKNLDRSSDSTYGVSIPDNKTIISNDGIYGINTSTLTRAAQDTFGISKPDNNTISATNGKYSVVTNNLRKASETRKGVVRLDPISFELKNNITVVKDYDKIINYIEAYKDKVTDIKTKSQNLLDKLNDTNYLLHKKTIEKLKCNQTTTTLLAQPAYKEEPVNMPVQHVYVSLKVVTTADFHISVNYSNNISPVIEICQVNYNDEFATDGIKGLDMVYPSTGGIEKDVVLHFMCKNFSSLTEGFSKTTMLTITIADVNDNSINKQLFYSIVRYNSYVKEEEYIKETSSNILYMESYIGSYWTTDNKPDIQHKFNSTDHLVDWSLDHINMHLVYTDNKDNVYFYDDVFYLNDSYNVYLLNETTTDNVILYSINVTDENNEKHTLIWTLYISDIPYNIVCIDSIQKSFDLYRYNITYLNIYHRDVTYDDNTGTYVATSLNLYNTYNNDELSWLDLTDSDRSIYQTSSDKTHTVENIFYPNGVNNAYIINTSSSLPIHLYNHDDCYSLQSDNNKFNGNTYTRLACYTCIDAFVSDMWVLPYAYTYFAKYDNKYLLSISGHYTNITCHNMKLSLSKISDIKEIVTYDGTANMNDVMNYVKYTYSIDGVETTVNYPNLEILPNTYVPALTYRSVSEDNIVKDTDLSCEVKVNLPSWDNSQSISLTVTKQIIVKSEPVIQLTNITIVENQINIVASPSMTLCGTKLMTVNSTTYNGNVALALTTVSGYMYIQEFGQDSYHTYSFNKLNSLSVNNVENIYISIGDKMNNLFMYNGKWLNNDEDKLTYIFNLVYVDNGCTFDPYIDKEKYLTNPLNGKKQNTAV